MIRLLLNSMTVTCLATSFNLADADIDTLLNKCKETVESIRNNAQRNLVLSAVSIFEARMDKLSQGIETARQIDRSDRLLRQETLVEMARIRAAKADLDGATSLLNEFDTSNYRFHICDSIGDVLVTMGGIDQARIMFEKAYEYAQLTYKGNVLIEEIPSFYRVSFLVRLGDLNEATRLAANLKDDFRSRALGDVALALASNREFEAAEQLARSIPRIENRAGTLSKIARVELENRARSGALLSEATRLIMPAEESRQKCEGVKEIARTLLSMGDLDGAIETTKLLRSSDLVEELRAEIIALCAIEGDEQSVVSLLDMIPRDSYHHYDAAARAIIGLGKSGKLVAAQKLLNRVRGWEYLRAAAIRDLAKSHLVLSDGSEVDTLLGDNPSPFIKAMFLIGVMEGHAQRQ